MGKNLIRCLLLAAASLPVAVPAADAPPVNLRWVQLGWADVRAAALADAKVAGHWTVNTRVQLIASAGEFCEARADDGLHGFVPCAGLAIQPRRLEDVEDFMAESDSAAFWLAPTFARFARYGAYSSWRWLTAEQQETERTSHKAIRFPVVEFEAMKRRIAPGLLPAMESVTSRVPADEMKGARVYPYYDLTAALGQVFDAAQLPPARPSLFLRQRDVLLFAEASADGIAAMMDRPSVPAFKGVPVWSESHNDAGFEGIWDIGHVEVRYPEPIVLHAVSRQGLVSAETLASGRVSGPDYSSGCNEGYAPLPAGKALPGYPAVNERLVAFHVRSAITARKVKVTTRRLQLPLPVTIFAQAPVQSWQDFMLHAIDLNADGRADLAVLEGRRAGAVFSEMTYSTFYFFANIAGRWWFAGLEEYGECT